MPVRYSHKGKRIVNRGKGAVVELFPGKIIFPSHLSHNVNEGYGGEKKSSTYSLFGKGDIQ